MSHTVKNHQKYLIWIFTPKIISVISIKSEQCQVVHFSKHNEMESIHVDLLDSNQSSTYLMSTTDFNNDFLARRFKLNVARFARNEETFQWFSNIVMLLKNFLRVSNLGRRFFPHFLNFDAEKKGLDVGSNLSPSQDNFLSFSVILRAQM